MTFGVTSIYFGVFVSSLLGSAHCVGMCGGLIASTASTLKNGFYYHVGRLLSYIMLGAAAGYLSEGLFTSHLLQKTQIFTSIILSLLFLSMGLKVWKGHAIHLRMIPPAALLRLQKWGHHKHWFSTSLFVGASSGLLPCGWLHTFVIAALAMKSPFLGALLLFVFWLGTLPALIISNRLIKQVAQPLSIYSSRVIGMFLILLGLTNISMKCYPLFTHSSDASESCPFHSNQE